MSEEGESNNLAFSVLGILLILFIVITMLSSTSLFSDKGIAFPTGDMKVGVKVINKEVTTVRQQIAGSIIGEQNKRQTGIISEGPVERFGTIWWRIDYPDAPDGWIDQSSLTSKVFLFRLIHIVPILYENFLRPVGIFLYH